METKTQNAILAIEVYKKGQMWMFDDDAVGLKEEPFVAGADTLIDILAKKRKRITLIFSEIKFPGHNLVITRKSGNVKEGTYYHCKELNHDLWLCPALGKYFSKSPKEIYIEYK